MCVTKDIFHYQYVYYTEQIPKTSSVGEFVIGERIKIEQLRVILPHSCIASKRMIHGTMLQFIKHLTPSNLSYPIKGGHTLLKRKHPL